MKFFLQKSALLITALLTSISLLAEIKTVTLRVKGMTCEICATNVRKQLKKIKGVQSLDSVDYTNGSVHLTLKPNNTLTRAKLEHEFKKRISRAGFTFDTILALDETQEAA